MLTTCSRRLASGLSRGLHAAGFFAYEAGPSPGAEKSRLELCLANCSKSRSSGLGSIRGLREPTGAEVQGWFILEQAIRNPALGELGG